MLTLLALVDKFGIPTFVSSAALIVALPSLSVPVTKVMSSRFVIPVMCVAAAAYACGPQTHTEASVQARSVTAIAVSNSAPVAQQGEPRRARVKNSALDAQVYVRTTEAPMRLSLHVVNISKKRVELTFPTGQTHDFVILDSAGREVWRWATGRMFTQALRNKLLGPGASLQLEEEIGALKLAPGRYIARGSLASENYPLVQETEFRVPTPTVASR